MRRLFLYHTFLIMVTLHFIETGFAQRIPFTPVTRGSDDPGGVIMQMAQDIHGFLWLATEHGLYKYDGHRYTSYHNEPLNRNSPASDNIWCILADKNGTIWLSPSGRGLDKLDPSTGMFTHIKRNEKDPNSLGSDSVTTLLQDRQGYIWIGTGRQGLDRFDPVTNTFKHYRHSITDTSTISCDAIGNLYEDKNGTLWIGAGNEYYGQSPTTDTDGGLNKFDVTSETFTRYLHNPNDSSSLIDNRVNAMFEDSRGVFWVGTAGDGLHTMDRKTGKFTRHPFDASNPNKLSRPSVKNTLNYVADHISFITEDKGKIWIGTFENGMNVYDPVTKKCTYYGNQTDNSGEPAFAGCWSVLKTKDNVVWLSTSESKLFKVLPYQNVLPFTHTGTIVLSFAEDNLNRLWLGTDKGLTYRDSNGKQQHVLIDNNESSLANFILGIEKVDDKFWLATPRGFYSFDPLSKSIKGFLHQQGILNSLHCDTVEVVRKGEGNTLWLGGSDGADLFDIQTEKFTHLLDRKAAGTDRPVIVTAVASDNMHNVWFGTSEGLFKRSSDGTLKRYLDTLNVFYTLQDRAGDIWTASNAGLYRYDRHKDIFLRFKDETAIVNMPLWAGGLTEDKKQQLWFISASGIVKVNKDRKGATLYSKNQGVNSLTSTYAGYTTRNGHVLYSDTAGYFEINPDLLEQKLPPPGLVTTSLSINNEPARLSENIHLNYDENTFSFGFTNIDFVSNQEDTRLLFKLEPFDREWNVAGDEQTARYFNVPSGKYIFRTRALNATGDASEKATIVIISPPWWRTWWAYTLFTLVAVSGVWLIYRNRIGQLKKKQVDQMKIMVATQEGERKRISRDLHDDVGTKLSALKFSLSFLQEKAEETNNPAIKHLSADAQQTITEVMQDVRQLLLNLSPVTLEGFGYTVAVEGLVNKINETKQIHFDLVIFGMKDRLRNDYELALYRITQELINNVLKHAGAKNVSLQIGYRDEKIILMIEDDGVGFDVKEKRDGFGLHSLQSRTKLMNGTMTIDSHAGKGTSILIEVPYNFSNI